MMRKAIALLVVVALCGVASGQNLFTNGDFETGTWAGWSVKGTANGQTLIQDVVMYDIDGAGPLPQSLAGRLSVGQITFQSGVWEGVLMTQSLDLTAGQQYGFGFDVSAWNTGANNAQGGNFELMVGSSVLASWSAGSIASGQQLYGKLSAQYTPVANGQYEVGLRITRPYVPPAAVTLFQLVDNAVAVPEPATVGLLALGLLLRRR
ncbi:MAG: PEP-CTERM sorting domain-containing protein [Planctomycetota bacterium]